MIRAIWDAQPIARRLPILAGVMVFAAAVTTTQLATRALEVEFEREAARLGEVYLDGLSAALAEPVSARDEAAIAAALQRALGFQQGIREQRLMVTLPGASRPIAAGAAEPLAPPTAGGWSLSADGRTAWAQRPLAMPSGPATMIAAQLDFSDSVARRARLGWALLGLDVLLAALAGALAALVTRRALSPVLAITSALDRAGEGRFAPLPPAAPGGGSEAARLVDALNLMMARLGEREQLAARLAERERAAQLGELAATVAHEVRNPLAGMLTAIGSARRFGEDRAVREESLDLLERGLRQLQRVVDGTLSSYRGTVEIRPLEQRDVEDLRELLKPEATRRGVALDVIGALTAPFPTDAIPVRQALLNLLLNAVQASPAGGVVQLALAEEPGGMLRLEVTNDGPGLPERQRRQLRGEDQAGPGLGLAVVMRELARLDGEITVTSEPERGTRVMLRLPARAALAP
jgi:two-component system, OmpR family, sensor kinase